MGMGSERNEKKEQPEQTEDASIYIFGNSIYKVRVHFSPGCDETLADVVDRLIAQDIDILDQ